MPRIRSIKPEFWDDLKISKVSRDARLLYIGMWNFADDLGVIVGDSLWIKSKVFPFDQIQIQQFDKWILELVQSGFISLFSHREEEFYYLPNLTRHQVINRPNLDKVNVQQSDLTIIINSLINHGTFTDESYSGEERKGKEEEKEYICRDESRPPPSKNDFKNFISSFNEIKGSKFRETDDVKRQFNARIKEGFTPEEMLQALKNAMQERHHIDTGYKHLTPEFFTRSNKIDKFLNTKNNSSKSFKDKFLEELNNKKNGKS